jgi:mannosyl-oligosaccharide alpha-1,2-mannosidase
MLLPIHRLLSSKAGIFSCLTKRPSFLLNKSVIRWIALACILIAFIGFGLGGPRLSNYLDLGPFQFEYPPPLAPHLERPLNPPPQPTKEEQAVWEPRKDEVREAFKHAWSGYKTIAYPNDELLSISGGTSNKLRSSLFILFLSIELFLPKGLTAGA